MSHSGLQKLALPPEGCEGAKDRTQQQRPTHPPSLASAQTLKAATGRLVGDWWGAGGGFGVAGVGRRGSLFS